VKQTLDVKAALMLAQSIDASHINVDTDAETRTVTLRGSEPTDAQKMAVAKVAREKADGYQVVNLLTVPGAPWDRAICRGLFMSKRRSVRGRSFMRSFTSWPRRIRDLPLA
jgi:hypothetical protein